MVADLVCHLCNTKLVAYHGSWFRETQLRPRNFIDTGIDLPGGVG
jgi:hypothetical protein